MLRPELGVSSTAGRSNTFNFSSSPIWTFASDLLELSKPGIMILLLISTACPMIVAGGGSVDLSLFLYTILGGALVSASASTMNCIWDRDIDAVMHRTRNRPIPAGRVSPLQALVFSLLTGISGLWVMLYCVNTLAAFLSLSGHLFYVLVYTVMLKRSTPQNIVIGGAAGAVPPLVGWAAVTGDLSTAPWLMFLVIFLWTPPHFWALALNKNSDYRRANVPMLPVVSGDRTTVWQMFVYSLLLIPVSIWLVYSTSELGLLSLSILTALGMIFSFYILQLWKALPEQATVKTVSPAVAEDELRTRLAWRVFKFSLLYLALFFGCMLVDSALIA